MEKTIEPIISPAAPATVTHGVFNNPGYAGPVPASRGPMTAADGHASLLQDVTDGRLTYAEAVAESKNMKWGELPPLAPFQERQRAAPAASPVATGNQATDLTRVLAHRDVERQIAALKADPAWVKRWVDGDPTARAQMKQLIETAGAGRDAAAASIEQQQAPEAKPAVDPTDPAGASTPAAPSEIEIPSLVEFQREAVAKGAAAGGTEELLQAAQRAQDYLAAADMPAPQAKAIAADFAHDEPMLRAMDDTAWQLHENSVRAQLQQKWGDRAGDMLGLARLLVAATEANTPGVTTFLRSSGMGSHYPTLVRLAEHGARLAQRNGRSIESLRTEFPKLFM